MFSANSSEVEDCVQEIYLLLYRKIKYYDPRQGSFSAWFNALVRNRIYDYGRKLAGNREILPETSQQYFKEITDRNVYINPEARIEHAEREQILDEILDNIGEGQRICIQMYYNDGLKIKEIAQILNISEGTVKSRIHNGLKKLNTKVDEMQERGLYTFRMLPLGFLLWLLSRDDCSAKEDYRALYHARTLAGQNVLQNAPMAAGNKAAGIKMAGRNQNVVKHASMQQAGQAGAKHAAINHAARAASRAGGKAIKAGMVKALAGGITAAVIGSGVFIGGKALKQHQGDKKVITSGQEYSTQEEKEGTLDSSVKEFVDDNQAFIKEILALEAEVPEGTEFQTDINENVRSVVYTSLGLLCDNKSFGEEATNIYDAVPEESIVDYGNTILYSSARNEYIIKRLKRMMRRTVWALTKQLEKGDFMPGGYEISFGGASGLSTSDIALDGHGRMRLRGKIDRVDICEDEDNVYVKVIDYKTGRKRLIWGNCIMAYSCSSFYI